MWLRQSQNEGRSGLNFKWMITQLLFNFVSAIRIRVNSNWPGRFTIWSSIITDVFTLKVCEIKTVSLFPVKQAMNSRSHTTNTTEHITKRFLTVSFYSAKRASLIMLNQEKIICKMSIFWKIGWQVKVNKIYSYIHIYTK